MSGAQKITIISFGITGIIFIVIGMCMAIILASEDFGTYETIDYTNCTDDTNAKSKCIDRVKIGKACNCLLDFELKEPIEGQTFLLYTTPDIRTSENYILSRDDKQLAGILKSTPSANCGDFSTDDGKPIAPCGEIADSFLEDTYYIYTQINGSSSYLPTSNVLLRGITTKDKRLYGNPPGNLKAAFKKFAKPKNWTKNIWELDENPDNNGFRNEKFIGWMSRDLTLKPALRFIHTGIYKDGIPAGNYTLTIDYKKSSYVNQRIIVISSKQVVVDESKIVGGGLIIGLGLTMSITSTYRWWKGKMH